MQDAGIGFILVIDRRQDKWTSVKASILRIAASFPANLQLVLVLRPTGFFQRTLSDLAFRFNRDDFKMKVPVIMLSSVPELHSYIDKSQLTEDLGGTLDYCHSRWLCHRTQKLEQCLQLRHFEQDFREHYAVDSIRPKCHELRQLCDQLAADSMKWCDEGIYLLASQPVDKCQSQDGAEAALQEIEKFLETGAENKIQELSRIYQDYEPILTRDLLVRRQLSPGRRGGALMFPETRAEHVQKVFRKQESVEEMFHRRQASLKKLAAKQTRPVQPVAPRPEAPTKSPCPSPGYTFSILEARCGPVLSPQSEVSEGRQGRGRSTGDEESLAILRRHVMNELLDTERVYVEELLCILEGYAAEMDNPLMTHLISTGLQNKKDVLFGNMEEIYHFHNRIFLRELENYIDCPELVGRCFLEREMLKYSKSCEGAEDLQEALSSILGILKAVNDSMHLIAITGYEGNLSDLGKLLMQGSFSVWTDHKKGHAKVKDLARFKPMQRHLFLHEKAVLFCKKREENGEGYEKAPSYSFKQSLNMTAVGITENVKGDAKKFEIWYNAREEVYIVQAPTPEVKAAWVSEIRKVLTSQLQACREASQHRALEQSHSLPLPAPAGTSPSKGNTKNVRKLEERKTDPLNLEGYVGPALLPRPPEKGRDDAVTSSTSESSALSKKRFTLQSFAALKGQKASPTSPDKKAKRHQVKSDPTPFGLRGQAPPADTCGWRGRPQAALDLEGVLTGAWSSLGWSKTSHPSEAPEDNDGWSSAEEPINSSDAEEEGRVGLRKLVTLAPALSAALLVPGGRVPAVQLGAVPPRA
ncbi:hypothetical protein E2I00_014996 [Balaenoptera physalus]|uniref:DH domain-containing protein n=1 Tax=Balaenoptera physalus TaxID=9770 RepID=A0A6A1Q8Q6_BALPH|nr:hypothetical protein E2I00_014996 [Balaenoptera physalus]